MRYSVAAAVLELRAAVFPSDTRGLGMLCLRRSLAVVLAADSAAGSVVCSLDSLDSTLTLGSARLDSTHWSLDSACSVWLARLGLLGSACSSLARLSWVVRLRSHGSVLKEIWH